MNEFRINYTLQYLADLKAVFDAMEENLTSNIDRIATLLDTARANKNTVFIAGNGGSAATASHFVGDLSKLTITEGIPRFKAIALTDNTPNILAWANDACYEDIFIEQLKNLMEKNDIVIGISASGNSMNIIKAIEYANRCGGITIGLSGCGGGKLAKIAWENVVVPSTNIPMIEDVHMVIEHLLTSMLREENRQ